MICGGFLGLSAGVFTRAGVTWVDDSVRDPELRATVVEVHSLAQ